MKTPLLRGVVFSAISAGLLTCLWFGTNGATWPESIFTDAWTKTDGSISYTRPSSVAWNTRLGQPGWTNFEFLPIMQNPTLHKSPGTITAATSLFQLKVPNEVQRVFTWNVLPRRTLSIHLTMNATVTARDIVETFQQGNVGSGVVLYNGTLFDISTGLPYSQFWAKNFLAVLGTLNSLLLLVFSSFGVYLGWELVKHEQTTVVPTLPDVIGSFLSPGSHELVRILAQTAVVWLSVSPLHVVAYLTGNATLKAVIFWCTVGHIAGHVPFLTLEPQSKPLRHAFVVFCAVFQAPAYLCAINTALWFVIGTMENATVVAPFAIIVGSFVYYLVMLPAEFKKLRAEIVAANGVILDPKHADEVEEYLMFLRNHGLSQRELFVSLASGVLLLSLFSAFLVFSWWAMSDSGVGAALGTLATPLLTFLTKQKQLAGLAKGQVAAAAAPPVATGH